MTYKVGDRVFIKPWKLMEAEYGLGMYGYINTHQPWNPSMEGLLLHTDGILTVTGVGNNGYHCSHPLVNFERYTIMDEHIAGYAFDYGEEIEVKQNSSCINWEKTKFLAFIPGTAYSYMGQNKVLYRTVRPIQPPTIEITVKVNGETKRLSEISEETLLKIRKEH